MHTPRFTMMKNPRLKSLLVECGLVTAAQIDEAQARTEGAGITWIEHLIVNGLLDEERLCDCVSRVAFVQKCDPEKLVAVPRDVLDALPPDLAAEHRVVPIGIDAEGDLHVVMLDPTDAIAVEEATFFANRPVTREVGTATAIAWALHQHYGARSALWPRAPHQIAVAA
jgi:hypothetical protein